MKTLLLSTLFLLLATAGRAQSGGERGPLRLTFRLGRVVLLSGDTLDGPVALQFGPDLLLLAGPDGAVRTFAPVAVAACAVQQEMAVAANGAVAAAADPNQVRLFRALPWYPDRSRSQPEIALFEQLGGGPILLLRRQRLGQRKVTYTPPPVTVGAGVFGVPVGGNSRGLAPPSPLRYLSLPEWHDEFFLFQPAHAAPVPLRPGLKGLLLALPGQAPQLQAYARAHHLNAGSARELTELVGYANALAAPPAP